jgi:hypothetical protein
VCWEIAGACAYSNGWAAGNGTCDEGAPDHYEFRTVRATWEHDNVTRTVEVENHCDAHAREASNWQSSSLRVHYTEHNASSQSYRWAWLDWYGTDNNATGSTCTARLWTFQTDPLPEGNEDLGCPAGRPPFALLTVP